MMYCEALGGFKSLSIWACNFNLGWLPSADIMCGIVKQKAPAGSGLKAETHLGRRLTCLSVRIMPEDGDDVTMKYSYL